LTVLEVIFNDKNYQKMATRSDYQLSQEERKRRIFSEDFKKMKVQEIERKQTTISEICKQYQVRYNNVYKWMGKYSAGYKKGVRLVVEAESDTKKMIALQAKIAELERIVGQKQIQLDFQAKMIDLAEQTYGVDIKKKFDSTPSSSTGKTEKS
jgi:transposase